MLKIGNVYKYEDDFWYVYSKRKYRRIFYTVKRVNMDGSLGHTKEVFFKRNAFVKADVEVKVEIRVKLPEKTRAEMWYTALVRETRALILEFSDKKTRRRNKNYPRLLAQHALGSLGHFDHERNIEITLKTFAKDIGLKNAKKLYAWVTEHYKNTCPDSKYVVDLPRATDTTIIGSYKQYQQIYRLLIGNTKNLDHYVERDL